MRISKFTILFTLIITIFLLVATSAFSQVPFYRAFIWDSVNGTRDLNQLIPKNSGWVISVAYEINDEGQIAGSGYINGEYRNFLLTPKNKKLYEVIDLGPNFNGYELNNQGEIGGVALFGDDEWRPAIRTENGDILDLGTLGGDREWVRALNDLGQIVGRSNLGMTVRAYIGNSVSGLQELSTPGSTYPDPRDINNNGEIIWVDSGPVRSYFRTVDGAIIEIIGFGGQTGVSDINNIGQAVGSSDDNNVLSHAYIWTEIDGIRRIEEEYDQSHASKINDYGEITGFVEIFGSGRYSFFYDDVNGLQIIDTLYGGYWSYAISINDSGEVVGFFEHPIAEIQYRFDLWVRDGVIVGTGEEPQLSLEKMRKMLEKASEPIEQNQIKRTCKALMKCFVRCDEVAKPPDLVTGYAVSELNYMIWDQMTGLACE